MKMIHIPKIRTKILILSILITLINSIPEKECKAEFNESISESKTSTYYGTDVSWPMHDTIVHEVLGGRQNAYEHFINGCYGKEGKQGCDDYENMRISMNIRQPQSMRVRL